MKKKVKLSEIENEYRDLIMDYCNLHGMTLNKFCVEAKLHQTNLRLFLNGSSVNSKTLEKIGLFLENNS